MKLIWKMGIVLVAVCAAGFFGLAGLGFWHLGQVKKTADAVEKINSYKITMDDVMGVNLPPKPDQKLDDSTVAGIDANNNGIRDDVELAIFSKYPNSARTRAAELQYAQALQLELTQVFNSETLVAALKREDSAYFCLGDSQNGDNMALNEKENEVKGLVLDTGVRSEKESKFFNYMTGYSLPKSDCDLDLASSST